MTKSFLFAAAGAATVTIAAFAAAAAARKGYILGSSFHRLRLLPLPFEVDILSVDCSLDHVMQSVVIQLNVATKPPICLTISRSRRSAT